MTRSITPMATYATRIVDQEIGELLEDLPALSLEGPKGVGKTESARRRRVDEFCLDNPAVREIIGAQPNLLTTARRPTLIDEWQSLPESWDVVRRAIDADPSPGQFILTGSATPSRGPAHSGAARITPIRMRPLTLPERGLGVPTVSLGSLLTGTRPELSGKTDVVLSDYTEEILAGGFPGMRYRRERAQRAALNGYLEAIINVDLPELGANIRNPEALRRWLRAYAAATSTVTSFDKIRAAAVGTSEPAPAKSTVIPYRDALQRIWVLDPVPAWAPTHSHLKKLIGSPKHHLVDPALAARLAGLDIDALLRGAGPKSAPEDGSFLGQLFESLATLNLRVFAQAQEARTFHMRTQQGLHEVDIIIERGDQRVVGVEVKLSESVIDEDVKHLAWLKEKLGDQMLDGIILTTGMTAYRRRDGFGVVPLALLGP